MESIKEKKGFEFEKICGEIKISELNFIELPGADWKKMSKVKISMMLNNIVIEKAKEVCEFCNKDISDLDTTKAIPICKECFNYLKDVGFIKSNLDIFNNITYKEDLKYSKLIPHITFIDEFNRIHIPKFILDLMNINCKDTLEVYKFNGKILIRKVLI